MRFRALEKLINLQPGYRRQFKIDNLLLLLIQEGEERYLIEGACPHQGFGLEKGIIHSGSIECPLHRFRFSLLTGELAGQQVQHCRHLRIFELIYEGNEVGVMIND